MHLCITDQDGILVGELDAATDSMWRDVLSYVAQRWEKEAHTETRDRLRAILARVA